MIFLCSQVTGFASAPEECPRKLDFSRSQSVLRSPEDLAPESDRNLERQQRLMRLFADSMDTGMDVLRDAGKLFMRLFFDPFRKNKMTAIFITARKELFWKSLFCTASVFFVHVQDG